MTRHYSRWVVLGVLLVVPPLGAAACGGPMPTGGSGGSAGEPGAQCRSDRDCPVLAICRLCPDGSCANPNVRCVDGSCTAPNYTCPPTSRVRCGGISDIECPGAGRCVDDPTDDCSARTGRTDCAGQCACDAVGLCIAGYHWDPSTSVCGCVPDTDTDAGVGARCGSRTCGAGQYCCNASCGICAPIGGACIQIACEESP
jgi:hypothetical protein